MAEYKMIPLPIPHKGTTIYEQIVLSQDGYPFALFHVDLLWNTPEHKEIHERLCAGETVEVEMFFKAVETGGEV